MPEAGQPGGGYISIVGNQIVNSSAVGHPSGLFIALSSPIVDRNHFSQLTGPQAVLQSHNPWEPPPDSAFLRDNLFADVGVAAEGSSTLDARWNWWGHETGPHHILYNPDGQGEEVQGDLWFEPWHTDTSFLAVQDFSAALPKEFLFTAFPNPFNLSTTLRMTLTTPQTLEITAFNILGQKVARVWQGIIAKDQPTLVRWDATNERGQSLSSGIYYLVATPDGPGASAPKSIKVVLIR